MTDLTYFPLFSSLPAELRLKIYAQILPSPRVVPIRFSRASSTYHTTEPPVALLHVCRESRVFFLSFYTLLNLSPRYPSNIYINLGEDTLFFDSLDCSPDGDLALDLGRMNHEDRGRVKRIAFDVGLWEVLRVFRWEGLSEVCVLSGLKSVALVLKRENEGSEGTSVRREELRHDNLQINGGGNTFEEDIRNAHFYVEELRWEIERKDDGVWTEGRPNVQLWLW